MERVEYLDGLRGLAILGVLMIHVGQTVSGLPVPVAELFGYGFRGVQLFFIVSALTLSMASAGRRFDWKAFYTRRFFRIAPMFYLALIFYLMIWGMGARPGTPEGFSLSDIALTGVFLHGFSFSSINSVVPGGWSIAAEMLFYLCFPLLTMLMSTLTRAIMVLALGTVVSFVGYRLWGTQIALFSHFGFISSLPAFLCGITIFRFITDQSFISLPKSLWAALAVVCLGILTAVGTMSLDVAHNEWLAIYLLASLVGCVAMSGGTFFNNPVIGFIGKISFSIYLTHFAVLYFVRPLMPVGGNPVTTLSALYAVVLALSSAVSTLTYYFIEKPFIDISRRICTRFKPPTVAALA